MSAIKIDRGPDQNPWLVHASTVAEVDAHLTDCTRRFELLCDGVMNPDTLDEIRCVRRLRDELLDLRNELRALEPRAAA